MVIQIMILGKLFQKLEKFLIAQKVVNVELENIVRAENIVKPVVTN